MAIEVVQGFSRVDDAPVTNTRERIVWTTDERRLLDRVSKMFNQHGDKFLLRCGNPVCPDDRVVLAIDDSSPGGRVLRCGCSDRCFIPSC